MSLKKINSGAEAEIYLGKAFDKKIIIKKRISKKYRNPVLDKKIIKTRNKQEANLLHKVKKEKINTPTLYYVSKDKIIQEYLKNTKNYKKNLKKIGKEIARLHAIDVIHGDLNLINIIIKENKIYFIDFGLGFISKKIEDKATDLLVFKKTLLSNKKTKKYWEEIIEGYKKEAKNPEIISKIEAIEKRARYL
jgi:Kae1-associated kinase Bud32